MYQTRYVDDYMWILNFIQKLYNAHAKTECHDRAEYFRKFALFTEYLFKCLCIVLFSAIILYFLMPIYVYVVENKLIPLMPLYLPGIDETTISGY